MAVSLSDQITCIEREIGMRERVYPAWIDKKKMTPDKAASEIEGMRAVLKTLKSLQRFEAPIRATIRTELEREKMSKHPAVKAVLDAFPGAYVEEVRDA